MEQRYINVTQAVGRDGSSTYKLALMQVGWGGGGGVGEDSLCTQARLGLSVSIQLRHDPL